MYKAPLMLLRMQRTIKPKLEGKLVALKTIVYNDDYTTSRAVKRIDLDKIFI